MESTAANYGYGLSAQIYGCAGVLYNFSAVSSGALTFSFNDMASYAAVYDEFRIKRVWFDMMVSTNSVAASGAALDSAQVVAAPIFQVVFDPNSGTPPGSNTTLLGYDSVEVWHASTGNSRRTFTFTPKVLPLPSTSAPATGIELQSPWMSAASYGTTGLLSGNLLMYYDFEGTGGVQGLLTIYPSIEVEWRRQD